MDEAPRLDQGLGRFDLCSGGIISSPPGRLNNQPGPQHPSMGKFNPAGRPAISWGVVAAISLVLVGASILHFNQQHSGDPLKMRRELRKF
jgi:hypothetical protein